MLNILHRIETTVLLYLIFLYRCPSTVGTGQYDLLPLENNSSSTNNTLSSAELNQLCMHDKTAASWVSAVLGCTCALLLVAIVVLLRKVFILRKRPRIKKRIIVNKNVTPLTSCPPVSPDQCEITIENCCNMNICETVSIYSAYHINNCNFKCLIILVSL